MTKRLFTLFFTIIILVFVGALIIFCLFIASIDTKSFGIFFQKRIGQNAKPFTIFKIKTFNDKTKQPTRFGNFLRKYKLDELPQLINILKGDMTFVGPRPDIPGYADILVGSNRQLLDLKPGLTGLASIKYRNEEVLLAKQSNPIIYNDTVIWPDKARINNWYAKNRTLKMDFKILIYTIFPQNFDLNTFITKHNRVK